MKTIQIEIEDDLDQIVNLECKYSNDSPEPETNTLGGVHLHDVKAAWMHCLIGDKEYQLDIKDFDWREINERIEKEIEKVLS